MDSRIGDVRDLAHMKQVFEETKPEIVLHLAAQPIVRESYKNPVYTYETNVMGTVHLLECARLCPSVRSLVNVTTDKVYENREWEYGYRETDRLDGYDPYSNSKSCSELVTHSYVKALFRGGDFPGCLRLPGRKCHRRRRLCGGPHCPGLHQGHAEGGGDRGEKSVFHPPLSACAGAAVPVPDCGHAPV